MVSRPVVHRSAMLLVLLVSVLGGSVLFLEWSANDPTTKGFPRFEDVGDDVGFEYRSIGGTAGDKGGVYVSDFNHDGWPDLLVTGGRTAALFENTRGEFRRVEEFPEIGGRVTAALFFEQNGDGWRDLLILRSNKNSLLLRNDRGEFVVNQTLGHFANPIAATAGDYDRDGTLDVFVVQNGEWASGLPKGYLNRGFNGSTDNGNPNVLLHNIGSGLERVSGTGIVGTHWSLAASFIDINGDDWADIHVANDFYHDVIYVNQRNGTFHRRLLSEKTARNGMASEVADVNGDARPDIFVTNIFLPPGAGNDGTNQPGNPRSGGMFIQESSRVRGNNLLINRGNGSFVDRAGSFGVRRGGWGWAAVFADFDHDLDADLLHTTSSLDVYRTVDGRYRPPMIFERQEEGFVQLTPGEVGFAVSDGRGVATLDFDRDGDLDVAMAVYGGEYLLYENSMKGKNSIEVRIESADGPRIGARVRLTVDNKTRVAYLNAKGDFQSQDTRDLHFGLGEYENVDRIRVTWPNGTVRVFHDVRANRLVTITPKGIVASRSLSDRGGLLDSLLDAVLAL